MANVLMAVYCWFTKPHCSTTPPPVFNCAVVLSICNVRLLSEDYVKQAFVAVFIGLLLSVVAALITDIRLQHRYRGSSFRQLSDRERYLILSTAVAT